MKKIYKFLNKATAYLGLGLIAFGLILFIIREMSSNNPQNQPNQDPRGAQPQASNNQPLTTPTPLPLPFNAYFAIFTNGTFRIFNDPKYHNLDKTVFISSDTSPNTITVTSTGVTWRSFFETLPMKVSNNCLTTGTGQTFCSNTNSQLKFYINGVQNPDALNSIINENDRLLISYGGTSSAVIQNQIQELDQIK